MNRSNKLLRTLVTSALIGLTATPAFACGGGGGSRGGSGYGRSSGGFAGAMIQAAVARHVPQMNHGGQRPVQNHAVPQHYHVPQVVKAVPANAPVQAFPGLGGSNADATYNRAKATEIVISRGLQVAPPTPAPVVVAAPEPVAVQVATVIPPVVAIPVELAIPAPVPSPATVPATSPVATDAAAALADRLLEEPANNEVKPEQLPRIPVGATINLPGKDLGTEKGRVVVQVGDQLLPATVQEWKSDAAMVTLPSTGIVLQESRAVVHVIKASGAIAGSLPCLLINTEKSELALAK